MEKFLEPNNIFPLQIDQTLQEQQMKNLKIVKALDRILYLIGRQGISYRGTQKQLLTVTPYEIQEVSYRLLDKSNIAIFYYTGTFIHHHKKRLLYESDKSK